MVDDLRRLDHLYVVERAASEEFSRGGQGNAKVRAVERRAHGLLMRGALQQAFSEADGERQSISVSADELHALGSVIILEGAEATYPLKVESLNQMSNHTKTPKRPKWLLLSVHAATETDPERAAVWVSDQYRSHFLKMFEDYLEKSLRNAAPERWATPEGNPANQGLVANIARIRKALLRDLWTSEEDPPERGKHWWELWLDAAQPSDEALDAYATAFGFRIAPRSMRLRERVVFWVEATWEQLQGLPFTKVPLAEIRKPEFIDSVDDLPLHEQDEYVRDLADRIIHANDRAPVVTHLDTGVFQGHVLLRGSLDPRDVHTVVGISGDDVMGHGTTMAGLALYGNLEPLLLSSGSIQLDHRLESVRMVPGPGEGPTDPLDFGTVTADAVALPEITVSRPRVFCLPLSTKPDRPGEPTLWSATVDALAAGSDIVREGDQLRLLSTPDPAAARLIVVAAGNVDNYTLDYRDESDLSPIEDPGQAWNALTVSAHTDLVTAPSDLAYGGWQPLALEGELSPHSRTSMTFASRRWPIKPDICMEGGNVLSDGGSGFEVRHPLLSLRSTGTSNDRALASANATSAASAQAARLAARAMARYPNYWPETIRGLLTHAADWTPAMRAELDAESGKASRQRLLRRYGWGVPTDEAVLHSSTQAVTLVTQDEFVPFEGAEYRMRHFRLHSLPWPTEALEALGSDEVRLRVTLSYFVEPSASRRGWRRRYQYASHALRFDLQAPLETQREFVNRVNRDAQHDEEDGSGQASSSSARWFIGPNQRNLGSLHQDDWVGTGQELSASKSLAVYPVGGWWKNNGRADRTSLPVRYALLVSLRTSETSVDLYTPIANEIRVPTAIMAQ